MCPASAPPTRGRCIVAVVAAVLLALSSVGAPVAAAPGTTVAATPSSSAAPASDSLVTPTAPADVSSSGVEPVGVGASALAANDASTPEDLPTIDGQVPTDPDGDGRYEDVDGDGNLTHADVGFFFRHHFHPPVQNASEYFDYTGNDGASHDDVRRLFRTVATGNRSLIVPRPDANETDGEPGANGTDPDPSGSMDDGERSAADADLRTFANESEYRSYRQQGGFEAGGLDAPTGSLDPIVDDSIDWNDAPVEGSVGAPAAPEPPADGGSAPGGSDSGETRHSETNVQVEGVAEPDVVKTDGEWAYYAGGEGSDDATSVVDARTPTAPSLNGTVPSGGDLFLSNDTLVSVGDEAVSAFDVSDPSNPAELWSRELNHSVQTARMANGTIYLVTRERPEASPRCPIRPFDGPDATLPPIPCSDVFRPISTNGGDTTYAAASIDLQTGAVGDRVSFVGSASNTVVYVSQDAIYLTYEDSPSPAQVRIDYLEGPGSEHLDQQALDRLAELQTFGLTDRALDVEVEATVQRRLERLPADERAEVRTAIRDGFDQYVADNRRELVRSGIVRVDANGTDLAVDETGTVPGTIEGPFSLSERNGHLHVATTVDPSSGESVNDLYTLDGNLTVADSVTGMGVGQRIYSARYVGDRAYLVTFRQVDPFYVLNVSDPTNVTKMGKLKLPGFSDYMHPLGDHRILGVGEEDGQVKATLFDASDPTDPVVQDDVQFSDWSSVVSNTHRAFVHDAERERFVLPASDRAHVVSYGGDGLELLASIEPDTRPRRAVYIGDALYVFGSEELVVTNRTTWEELDRIQLGSGTDDQFTAP